MSPTRVLCVDDNRLVAEALERRLGLDRDVEWAGWVEKSEDILPTVERTSPGIVLLDLDMPSHDAFALTAEMVRRFPDLRVIIFSGHVRAEYVNRAFDTGAWGYVSKNDSMDQVLAAIRRVIGGEFVLTPDVTTACRHLS